MKAKNHAGVPDIQQSCPGPRHLLCCHILQASPDLTAMLRDWLLTFQSVTIIYMAREEAVHSGTAVETLDTFSSHFHFYATFTELNCRQITATSLK